MPPLDRRVFAPQKPQPRPPYLMWSYYRIAPGGQLRGFVAGPAIAVTVHWCGCSKPCRSAMTGGALPCEMCDPGKLRKRLITYLPVWDVQFKPRVITASESIAQAVLEYEHGTYIEARRTSGQRDPLRIHLPAVSEAPRFPDGMYKKGPQDITEWLLHLWDDPILASHLRQAAASTEQNAHSPTPVSAVESEPASSADSPRSASNGKRTPPPDPIDTPEERAAALAKLRERSAQYASELAAEGVGQPQPNGKPAKRKK